MKKITRATALCRINIQSRNVKTKAARRGQSFGSGLRGSAQAKPQQAPQGRYRQGPPRDHVPPCHSTSGFAWRGYIARCDANPAVLEMLEMEQEKRGRVRRRDDSRMTAIVRIRIRIIIGG